jgi:hypothetical protein
MDIPNSDAEQSAALLIQRFVRILGACGLGAAQILEWVGSCVGGIDTMDRPRIISTTDGAHLKACQVVFRWRRDRRFTDSSGLPAELGRREASPSFDDLVSLVLPGESSDHMLGYLQALEAVRCENGKVRLLVESVLASTGRSGDTLVPGAVLAHLNNFLRSVEFNLLEKKNNDGGRFERACYVAIPSNLVPIFERFVEQRGQDFVDVTDEWLERHRATVGLAGPRSVVGVGAYMFVHPVEVPIP